MTTLSKPAGLGPWRWNADTFARLGGEGWDLLFGGEQKVAKTLFASVAGWAKFWKPFHEYVYAGPCTDILYH